MQLTGPKHWGEYADREGAIRLLRKVIEVDTRRLDVDHIDLYYLHSGRATDVPFEDQISTLADPSKPGPSTTYWAVECAVEQLKAATDIVEIAAVPGHFNAVARHSPVVGVTA